jgi:hypothetical protein
MPEPFFRGKTLVRPAPHYEREKKRRRRRVREREQQGNSLDWHGDWVDLADIDWCIALHLANRDLSLRT